MCSGGASLSASILGLPLAPSGAVLIAVQLGAATPSGKAGVTFVGRGFDRDGIGSSAMKHHQFLTSVRTVSPLRRAKRVQTTHAQGVPPKEYCTKGVENRKSSSFGREAGYRCRVPPAPR